MEGMNGERDILEYIRYDDIQVERLYMRDLRKLLGVKKQELIRGGRYHNLNDLMDLPVERAPALREPPLAPLKHPGLGRAAQKKDARHG